MSVSRAAASTWRFEKVEAVAARGMVAAQHALGSLVGVDVLRRGGNAIDAAVATAFALGVVEPWNSGLGGGGFLISYAASTGRASVYDFNVVSPGRAHAEFYDLQEGTGAEEFPWRAVSGRGNAVGAQAIAVPGVAAGLARALENEGTIDLAAAVAPAIRLAEEGIPVDWYFLLTVAAEADRIASSAESAALFLRKGHQPPPIGTTVAQLELSRVLRALADEGPDVFYRGWIAEALVAGVKASGGVLEADDLAGYAPIVLDETISADLLGVSILGPPAPSGGPTVMAILEALDLEELLAGGHNSARALDAFARAAFAAFRLRYQQFGPGPAAGPRALPGATTHLCVIDEERNMVSLTQTLCSSFLVRDDSSWDRSPLEQRHALV